jgi:hypothetical protein
MWAGYTLLQAVVAATLNPAALLKKPEPKLAPGEPANFVVLRGGGFHGTIPHLVGTCVDGEWTPAPETPRFIAGG